MFNLFNFGDELTLPEQVEQNKQNIELLAEEVEKLGFSPKGEYDALTEYVKNDLVFYDGKMYAVKSDVAVVGVVPTNTEYWQQITGDVRGQAGAPGAPGAQGEKGDDGADALECIATQIASQPPVLNSTRWLPFYAFNRTPKVNDFFVMYLTASSGGAYICMYKVIALGGENQAQCQLYQNPILLSGEKGEPGKIALIYDKNIDNGTLDPSQSEQLLHVVLPFANFNRTPALNEDFVGVINGGQNIQYLAQCEVQSIIDSNVVSIVVSDVKRLTGENGTNGTNGANGRDALQMTYAEIVSAVPTPTQTLVIPNSAFNRNAQPNDVFTMIADYSSENRSFLCIVRVDSEVGGDPIQWNCTILSVVETTGQAAMSQILTRYRVNISASQSDRAKLYRILKNAKSVVFVANTSYNLIFQFMTYSNTAYLIGMTSEATQMRYSAISIGSGGTLSNWFSFKINTDYSITAGDAFYPNYVEYLNDVEIF